MLIPLKKNVTIDNNIKAIQTPLPNETFSKGKFKTITTINLKHVKLVEMLV